MLDGLTLNQGDGEAILEDFDLATIKYAEVFRGADASSIRFHYTWGRNQPRDFDWLRRHPFYSGLKAEVSAFSGQAAALGFKVSLIMSLRLWAAFAMASAIIARRTRKDFLATSVTNLATTVENRFYLTLDGTNRQSARRFDQARTERRPAQANPDAIAQDFNKDWTFIRLAGQNKPPKKRLSSMPACFGFIGILRTVDSFRRISPRGSSVLFGQLWGSLNFVSRHKLFGQRNILQLVCPTRREPTQNYENLVGHTGAQPLLGA